MDRSRDTTLMRACAHGERQRLQRGQSVQASSPSLIGGGLMAQPGFQPHGAVAVASARGGGSALRQLERAIGQQLRRPGLIQRYLQEVLGVHAVAGEEIALLELLGVRAAVGVFVALGAVVGEAGLIRHTAVGHMEGGRDVMERSSPRRLLRVGQVHVDPGLTTVPMMCVVVGCAPACIVVQILQLLLLRLTVGVLPP